MSRELYKLRLEVLEAARTNLNHEKKLNDLEAGQ